MAAPWLTKNHLPDGADALGVLLSAMAAGELVGAVLAGRTRGTPVRAIGVVQAAAAACFLALLAAPGQVVVGLGFFGVAGLPALLVFAVRL